MKRSPMPRRKRPMKPGKPLERSGTLASVNPAQTAKRRTRYAVKLRAMKRGEGYQEAMRRAGGRCERTIPALLSFGGVEWHDLVRCPQTDADGPLHAHHLTYARLGGAELATDLVIVCPSCHAQLEAAYPHRKRGRAA